MKKLLIIAILLMTLIPSLNACTDMNSPRENTSSEKEKDTEDKTEREEGTRGPDTVIYYAPDYEYDIMQDAEYLALDRYIYYTDVRTNETVIIPEDKVASYGPAVVTLKTMIDAIIAGDHETYNSLFSTNYYKADENRKPEPPFTMQQLYDIELTLVTTEDCVENNKRYTLYVYDVEYKIHKNNGTFRADLGHDDSRIQRFILSDSTGDKVLIDQIGDSN